MGSRAREWILTEDSLACPQARHCTLDYDLSESQDLDLISTIYPMSEEQSAVFR